MMKTVKFLCFPIFATFAISLSVEAQSQADGISESLHSCVQRGATSRLTIRDGKLFCSEQGRILWVRGTENWTAKDLLPEFVSPEEDGELSTVNNDFGPVGLNGSYTVDFQKLAQNDDLEPDARRSGSDLLIDTFIIERGGLVVQFSGNKMITKAFIDNEENLVREGSDGKQSKVNASEYAFYPFALIDEYNADKFREDVGGWDLFGLSKAGFKNSEGQIVASQVVLPGKDLCTKKKYWHGFSTGSRTRAYVNHTESTQFCYQHFGIDLPPNFKGDGGPGHAPDGLAALLVLPYSQKSPDGRESDTVALWSGISREELDRADYILLTVGETSSSPRIIIGMIKSRFQQ